MHKLFIKAIKGRRLTDSEKESVQKTMNDVRCFINGERQGNFSEHSIAGNLAIALAAKSASNQNKVELFFNWIEDPKANVEFDDELNYLCNAFYAEIMQHRTTSIIEGINQEKSLTHSDNPLDFVASLKTLNSERIYENNVSDLQIDFTVDRINFPCEVLDPRVVTIPPGKANEMHRHAHETVFVFLEGKGKVIVDSITNEVESGSFAYIPRWCVHQTVNTGDTELKFLAVADFGLTGKSFVGNYLRTARLKEA